MSPYLKILEADNMVNCEAYSCKMIYLNPHENKTSSIYNTCNLTDMGD